MLGFRFGIPEQLQADAFAQKLLDRYGPEEADKALSYLERVVDRIINKARGILPFNSLVMAIVTFQLRDAKASRMWLCMSIILLGVATFMLLRMFGAHFGTMQDYASIEVEAKHTARIIIERAVALNRAIFLAVGGLLIAALCFLLSQDWVGYAEQATSFWRTHR
jgi:hypothetical protein